MQWTHNGYLIRPAQISDAEAYYEALFNPMDPEVRRLTGSAETYPKQTVISFFLRCIADETRHDFLILDPEGRIVGESVINEYDPDANSANYRIALCGETNRGKGIGTWAVQTACFFAFEVLKLDSLTLSVFDFNPRAQHVYARCGFRLTGREEDELLMTLTRREYSKKPFLFH